MVTDLDEILLGNINTYHGYPYGQKEIDDLKRSILREIKAKNYISKEVLLKPFLYVGSYLDLEVPLFLGFSEIVMIDACYAFPKHAKELRDKIKTYARRAKFYENKADFSFAGRNISITIVGECFQNRERHAEFNIPLWKPTLGFGMIYSFAISGINFCDASILEMLCPGGYLCINALPQKIAQALFEKHSIDPRELHPYMIPFIEKEWNLFGYEYKSIEQDWSYHTSFLQKKPLPT